MSEFRSFPKIPRLNRDIIITEKIDGTNAQIMIGTPGIDIVAGPSKWVDPLIMVGDVAVWAGSRNRWITTEKDNHGFARWVKANAEDLVKLLGPGTHFGEWWGAGIQDTYKGIEGKRFSLFNVTRWRGLNAVIDDVEIRTVPVLYEGPWFVEPTDDGRWAPVAALEALHEHGSLAAPGFEAEGIVVFHTASGHLFKVTMKNDEKPKGAKSE